MRPVLVDATEKVVSGITYDPTKRSWRVAVSPTGKEEDRQFRRAGSYAQALKIRAEILGQAEERRAAVDRLVDGDALLDLSGLTDLQVSTLLMIIDSWR